MKFFITISFFLILSLIVLIKTDKNKEQYSDYFFKNLRQISAFEIKNENETFKIIKNKDDWFFQSGLKADKDISDYFLSVLASAANSPILCREKDCSSVFQIDEKSPKIILYLEDKKLQIKIGKDSSSPFSCYAADNNGYIREFSGLSKALIPSMTAFINKRIFSAGNPYKIKIIKKGREREFIREEGEWFSYFGGLKKSYSSQIKKLINYPADSVSISKTQKKQAEIIFYNNNGENEKFFINISQKKVFAQKENFPEFTFEFPSDLFYFIDYQ
ncbi:MAG: hypothetical protein GX447_07240 [Elusimicrobia bacterium]|nr:hypothetical protein [Elusimicrobiota bacterium]